MKTYGNAQIAIACGVVCEHRNKILMVKESTPSGTYFLNQPVGKLELNESLVDAALRETKEETGLTVELSYFLGVYTWLVGNGNTSVRFCFIANLQSGELRPELRTDEQIVEPVWLTRNELMGLESKFRNPVTRQCLIDYFSGIKYPLSVIKSPLLQ